MFHLIRHLKAAALPVSCVAMLLGCWRADGENSTITVMTRNVDEGTDLGYILAATDESSFIQGMAATLAELQASNFQQRAALLAAEIGAARPDLIALQEVALWRAGPIQQPPATNILYDQLDLILEELGKRNLHYGVIAAQVGLDAEAPAPSAGIDLRLTDRDVILANLDRPQAQFELFNAQTHRYRAAFSFGSPVLGQLKVPCGWVEVDVSVNGSRFRFVNTHLQPPVPGLAQAEAVQREQVEELLSHLVLADMPVVLVGDFNANAEPGPEDTGTAQRIVQAGYTDAWQFLHAGDPGYTWPLFGEDQNSGPTSPNERIDLVFVGSRLRFWFGRSPAIVSAERTGTTPPFASDHAGLVVRLALE